MDEITFKKRVLEWAKLIGVNPKEIQIRNMKTKWGSCSSTGRITFSQDLLNQPLDFIDFVIVHELLHLRYKNHNKMFKLMLDVYLKKKIED